jgi:hypothetical protein
MNSAPFEIIVQIEGRPLRRHILGPGNYLIGRDPACQIHLDLPDVTFHHASLILEAGAAWIEDLREKHRVPASPSILEKVGI